jgi:hypothetical protein
MKRIFCHSLPKQLIIVLIFMVLQEFSGKVDKNTKSQNSEILLVSTHVLTPKEL